MKFLVKYLIILAIITNVLLFIQNFAFVYELHESMAIYGLTISITDIMSTIWDLRYTFTILTGVIFIITCLLLSLNILLVIEYYRLRSIAMKGTKSKRDENKMNAKGNCFSSVISIAGTTLAMIGVGCASCGAVALSLLLSLVGVGANQLPFGGAEVGILGIVILSISCYTLWKKYKNPYVC